MADDSLIHLLLEAVADRQPVDRGALESELAADEAALPGLADDASLLRLLDEIAQAHGAFQSDIFGGDDGALRARKSMWRRTTRSQSGDATISTER